MDWQEYWNIHPDQFKENEFYKQVGKTVGGKPVSEAQLSLIVRQIRDVLRIGPEDVVLDLCCGNGLVTKEVANFCRQVVGVDYSAPLIQIARTYHKASNASYCLGSVMELAPDLLPEGRKFHKVYMHEALQYFDAKELACVIGGLRPVMSDACPIFFSGVPDKARLWDFYDTPERKADYLRRQAEGREAIGGWWEHQELQAVAQESGFNCTFIQPPAGIFYAHYRFDILFEPKRLT